MKKRRPATLTRIYVASALSLLSVIGEPDRFRLYTTSNCTRTHMSRLSSPGETALLLLNGEVGHSIVGGRNPTSNSTCDASRVRNIIKLCGFKIKAQLFFIIFDTEPIIFEFR